ncbi:MAG: response regulator transcription factor [Lachnospiraceae bacterium]|jgi:two-component system response regulator LytT|nr:response regulator transcription factor [Lachnospiraceae bacterium]
MFRIAICDDEPYFYASLRRILEDYLERKGIPYEIQGFPSGEAFLAQGIAWMRFHVLFLDIQMQGMDGLQTAKKIREASQDIFIVFTTAFITYLLEGYQVDAIRYILKDKDNFPALVCECMDAIQVKMNYVVKKKAFAFKQGKKTVLLDRLLYIESRLHQLTFHVMEGRLVSYTLNATLNALEKELAPDGFLRLHQSYLANMKHIEGIRRYKALMDNGIELDIPKARYREVEQAFIAYKGEI